MRSRALRFAPPAALLALAVGAAGQELRWPFDMDVALSSTFGEWRSRSFHAGVDLKTWGKTGYEVKAVADGYVWRLKTSPWGFGRVAYQKLEDGQIVVYAHLDAFAPRLARSVREEQVRRGRYSVDLWFEEGELPVRRDDLLAWSGESGTGPPHLHLELRNADNVPVNPLLHGFSVEDSTAPTLRRIGFTPIGMESSVAGRHEPVSFGLAFASASGTYESSEVVEGYGRIGVSVLAHDRGDVAPNKLAPYRLRLFVDGREIFSTTYHQGNAYSGDGHHIFLDRSRIAPGGHFNNLFIMPGNRLGFYESPTGNGVLGWGPDDGSVHLAKGVHELGVQVEDVAGNSSRGRIRVSVNADPTLGPLQLLQDGDTVWVSTLVNDADDGELQFDLSRSADGTTWSAVEERTVRVPSEVALRAPAAGPAIWRARVRDGSGGEALSTATLPDADFPRTEIGVQVDRRYFADYAVLAMRFDQLLRSYPRVVLRDGSRRQSLTPRQQGLASYSVLVPLRPDGGREIEVAVLARARGGSTAAEVLELNQQAIGPWSDRMLHFEGGSVTLIVPGGSAFASLFPQVDPIDVESAQGLVACGSGYAFGPDGTTFDRNVAVVLQYPTDTELPAEKLGVYHMGPGGSWTLVGNDLNLDQRTVSAWVRRFSRFALMADLIPPEISKLSPRSGSITASRRPRLAAQIADKGAGIGREEDVMMELDGEAVIAEYDPEARTLTHHSVAQLRPGSHRLLVTVRDRAGNESTAESEFTVE